MWCRRFTPRRIVYALTIMISFMLIAYVCSDRHWSISSFQALKREKLRPRMKSEWFYRKVQGDASFGIRRSESVSSREWIKEHRLDQDENWSQWDVPDTRKELTNNLGERLIRGTTVKTFLVEESEESEERFDYAGDFIARAEEKDFPDQHNRYKKVKAVIKRMRTVEPFSPTFSKTERSMVFDLFKMFDDICKRHRITYFICGGTLLGSYRHHDLIPWDDDADVFIPVHQKTLLIDAMGNLDPMYKIDTSYSEHFKIFTSKSDIMSLYYNWGWPYLDVNFYGENETHIWDIAEVYGRTHEYRKDHIFPLHLRPLGKLWLPSPYDTYAYLYYTYGATEDCAMNHYSHKIEMAVWCNALKRKCRKMKDKYPWVFRKEAKGGVMESLKINGTLVHSYIVHEPTYAVTKHYGLILDERVYRKYLHVKVQD